MNLQFRPMTDADLPQVLVLEQRSQPHPWTEVLFRRELENPHAAIDLALAAERPVGYVVSWLVAGELEIQNVVTDPDWRRRGVAKALLERLVADAVTRGAERALLEVRSSNVGAIALYAGFGFVVDGQRRGYYSDGEDAVLMSLPLVE